MALSLETINESELAKSLVMNSDLDENYKKTLLTLINTTTIATNGVSPEEKIQLMTDAIHLLAVSQVHFVTSVNDRIINSIQSQNMKQCHECKAMKFVEKEEEKLKLQEYIEQWKKQYGITDQNLQDVHDRQLQSEKLSVIDTIKSILLKPYFWIFSSVLVFSPYGLEIIKAILENCNK